MMEMWYISFMKRKIHYTHCKEIENPENSVSSSSLLSNWADFTEVRTAGEDAEDGRCMISLTVGVGDSYCAEVHHAANHRALSDSYMESTWVKRKKERLITETVLFITHTNILAV